MFVWATSTSCTLLVLCWDETHQTGNVGLRFKVDGDIYHLRRDGALCVPERRTKDLYGASRHGNPHEFIASRLRFSGSIKINIFLLSAIA